MKRFWRDKRIMISVVVVICLVGIGIGVAVAMSSDNYDMPISADSGGGDERSSANYHLIDAAGQSTAIGVSSSGSYTLYAGYIAQVASLGGGGHTITIQIQPFEGNRADGSDYPMTVKFFTGASGTWTPNNPVTGTLAYGPYTGSGTYNDTTKKVLFTVPELIASGTYDVVATGTVALENVKNDVGITGDQTVDMCTAKDANTQTANSPYKVDFWDLQVLLNAYDCSPGQPCYDNNPTADIDYSSKVDFWDLQSVLGAYDHTGPTVCP